MSHQIFAAQRTHRCISSRFLNPRHSLAPAALRAFLVYALLFNACLVLSLPAGASTVPLGAASATQSLSVATALPAGKVGLSYEATIPVLGGTPPYKFSLTSGALPNGLLMNPAGVISGTPATQGTFKFTVTVTDGKNQSKAISFQIVVSGAASVSVVITPTSSTVASDGKTQFTALVSNTANSAVTWSATRGTISSSGLYTGPSVSSNTTAVVTATSVADVAESASAYLTITAPVVLPVIITTSSASGATTGTAYAFNFAASGGKAPYNWRLSSGPLPAGLELQSNGLLTGTTNQSGSFNFALEVADGSSPPQTASQSFTFTVTMTGGSNLPPATLFGFTENDTQSSAFPTVGYGMERFWDSPPLQWPFLNPAAGVFDFKDLDSALAQAYSNGVTDGMYTLARTPPWATSKPSDTTCHYTGSIPGDGNGECDTPSDLSPDGSGSNAIWKAWITAIATHVNSAGYTSSHAHIQYWEIWNEPDTQSFFSGSIAQLARLTEDANCIITGRGVIHENGNGTATPCSAEAIDPTAQIVMASAHAKGVALVYGQNELYCNNTSRMPAYQLPCPNPPSAIAHAVDIINFHMKPGNESGNTCPVPTPCTPESAMQMYVSNVEGMLQPAERAKPLWDGEASYSKDGFSGAYADAGMAASFMPRYYLVNWSLGISGMAWYAWDELRAQPTEVQTAYQQTYEWLSNASLDSPCTAKGTVWSCVLSKSGSQYLVLWDSSQTCSGGQCTTSNQTVSAEWTGYQEMTSAGPVMTLANHSVPVGIKPIVLN